MYPAIYGTAFQDQELLIKKMTNSARSRVFVGGYFLFFIFGGGGWMIN